MFLNFLYLSSSICSDVILFNFLISLIISFFNISDVFEEDVYQAIDVNTCVNKRNTIGACGQEMMKKVITLNEEYLKQF